jgi:5'-AMP-activated protein kinase regulatory beta subunit
VYVTGSFNNWKEKIPLAKSEKDFFLIQNLPPGVHQYKFIVDGKWRHAPDQPIAADVHGNINNCMEVKIPSKTRNEPSTPPGSYTQTCSEEDYYKDPPNIPPHLLRALLNTSPCSEDPAALPLPHHVMINHLYSMSSTFADGSKVAIMGATYRYQAKYVTTVFYKPFSPSSCSSSSSYIRLSFRYPIIHNTYPHILSVFIHMFPIFVDVLVVHSLFCLYVCLWRSG